MSPYAATFASLPSPQPSLPISGFEGPEKVLEIWFSRPDEDEGFVDDQDIRSRSSSPDSTGGLDYRRVGLRTVPRRFWDDMLTLVRAEIISSVSNEHLDSYLLSESSMFVYPYKLVIKTCGTTTLLNALPRVLKIAEVQCGLTVVENVFYSRKNFNFPEKQLAPHRSFSEEVQFLDSYFENGSAYVVGRMNGDHWYLYMTENKVAESRKVTPDQTLEILMAELDPVEARKFYQDGMINNPGQLSKVPGVSEIYPETLMDEFMFTPCGYSMNGLMKNSYYTIHVTPEPHCSFASFETNVPHSSYTRVLNHVLAIFRPGRFTVSLLSSKACSDVDLPEAAEVPGYVRKEEILYRYVDHDLKFHHYIRVD